MRIVLSVLSLKVRPCQTLRKPSALNFIWKPNMAEIELLELKCCFAAINGFALRVKRLSISSSVLAASVRKKERHSCLREDFFFLSFITSLNSSKC